MRAIAVALLCIGGAGCVGPAPDVPGTLREASTATVLTVEAEAMTITGSGVISPDASAGGGNAVILFSTANVSKVVTLAARVDRLLVRASGSDCTGPPQMSVSVDGAAFPDVTVATSGWARYGFPVALAPGAHTIAVAFTNDAYQTGVCDRNLYLDDVELDVTNDGFEAESMMVATQINTAVLSDDTASGRQALILASNNEATTSLTLTTAATLVTVRAHGDQCDGAPQLLMKIDGTQALVAAVAATSWTAYPATVALSVGTHAFSLAFTNDYAATGCDRNLYLDAVDVGTGPRCAAGTHECGGDCVSDTSVASCGAACTPCPAGPDGSTPSCDGQACGFTCTAGLKACNGGCSATCCQSASDCAAPPRGCASAPPTCTDGQCLYQSETGSTCDAVCRQTTCDPDSGACDESILPDGTPCALMGCASAGSCASGTCSCPAAKGDDPPAPAAPAAHGCELGGGAAGGWPWGAFLLCVLFATPRRPRFMY